MSTSLIAPQRAYLYGLPLALLIFTLLLQAVSSNARRPFIVAGVMAGLLPFAHLSTLLALAVITPWIFLLFPSWRWLWFFAAWVALAVPQLYLQQGGDAGAVAAMRVQLGWMAAHDGWGWFWLKNLGAFLPLLVIALFRDRLLPAPHRRFLLGFMPAFVIANVVVFQPWDWDNTKVLVVWYLGASIFVAVLLASLWRAYRNAVTRASIGALVASMILSGIMVNANQLLGRDRNLMASPEALALAKAVRSSTRPDALFLTGLQHNNPIPMLAGRHVVMGYPGWLWSQGYAYQSREADLRAMFGLAPGADTLLRRYGVDFVVIGPGEREQLGADTAAYEARYPLVLRIGATEVFAAGTSAASR